MDDGLVLSHQSLDGATGLLLSSPHDAAASLLSNGDAAFKWKKHRHWLNALWHGYVALGPGVVKGLLLGPIYIYNIGYQQYLLA